MKIIQQEEPVFLKPEAATYLKISMTALGRLIKDGCIAKVQLTPRRVGILKTDLDAYLKSKRTGGVVVAEVAA